MLVCALGEEKNLLNFNDKSVCQAIGYYTLLLGLVFGAEIVSEGQ